MKYFYFLIMFFVVKANPTIPWDWNLLSLNQNFNIQIALDNLDKPWNWQVIRR